MIKWQERCSDDESMWPFFLRDLDGGKICGGLSSFADDTFSKKIVKDGTAASALQVILRDDQIFNEEVKLGGWAQNTSKRDLVPMLCSKKENRKLCMALAAGEGNFSGKVKRAARHLGGLFTWNLGNGPEIRARLRAMGKGWSDLGKLWHCPGVGMKLKRSLFIGKVLEAGHSGLMALAPTAAQYNEIDKKACGMLRSLLMGKAFERKLGCSGGKRWTNFEVLRHWRLLPAFFEDGVRRVKWLQAMVRRPESNRQVRAAVFGGCMGFENLEEDGQVRKDGSPSTLAFARALNFFKHISGWETFFEHWEDFKYSWEALLLDKDLVETFLMADPTVLRQAFWTCGPGPWNDLKEKYMKELQAQGVTFSCEISVEGVCCGATFDSFQQMVLHQMRSKKLNHGLQHPLLKFVVNNQCPVCSTPFANETVAKHHLFSSYRFRRCCPNRSAMLWEIDEPPSTCPECVGFSLGSGELLQHIRDCHLPKPLPFVGNGGNTPGKARLDSGDLFDTRGTGGSRAQEEQEGRQRRQEKIGQHQRRKQAGARGGGQGNTTAAAAKSGGSRGGAFRHSPRRGQSERPGGSRHGGTDKSLLQRGAEQGQGARIRASSHLGIWRARQQSMQAWWQDWAEHTGETTATPCRLRSHGSQGEVRDCSLLPPKLDLQVERSTNNDLSLALPPGSAISQSGTRGVELGKEIRESSEVVLGARIAGMAGCADGQVGVRAASSSFSFTPQGQESVQTAQALRALGLGPEHPRWEILVQSSWVRRHLGN